MKKTDIVRGTVYAWKQGTYRSADPVLLLEDVPRIWKGNFGGDIAFELYEPKSRCGRRVGAHGTKGWAALSGDADELAKVDIDKAFRAFKAASTADRSYNGLFFTIVRAAEVQGTWADEVKQQEQAAQNKQCQEDYKNDRSRELAVLAPRLRALGVTVNLHGRIADVAGEETAYMQTFDVTLGDSRPEIAISREGLVKLIELAEEYMV